MLRRKRLWASLAHIPTITIIWTLYLLYHYDTLSANMHFFDFSRLPIMPIVLTFMSVPISLAIMHIQQQDAFVYSNAHAVFIFNMWLLKSYGTVFIIALIGYLLKIDALLYVGGIVALLISGLSIGQSFFGVATALRGGIYHYWYPGKNC